LVVYFAATFLRQQMKLHILCEKLLIVSQRFFGIPPFRFYALALVGRAEEILRKLLPSTHLHPKTFWCIVGLIGP